MRRASPSRATAIVLLMALASFFSLASLRASEPKESRPPIYDPSADVKAQIAAALQKASDGNKSVLLMFGANWCPWCHKLHELFRTDDAVRRYLDDHFLLVMVDIGEKKGEPLNQDVVGKYCRFFDALRKRRSDRSLAALLREANNALDKLDATLRARRKYMDEMEAKYGAEQAAIGTNETTAVLDRSRLRRYVDEVEERMDSVRPAEIRQPGMPARPGSQAGGADILGRGRGETP